MRILIEDMKRGFKSTWKKYIFAALLILLLLVSHMMYLRMKMQSGAMIGSASPYDYYKYLFKGLSVEELQQMKIFQIPYCWLAVQFIASFLVSNYITLDQYGAGKIILIRTGNRKKWWLSKTIWNLITIVIYYCMIWAIIILFTHFTGENHNFIEVLSRDYRNVMSKNGKIATLAVIVMPLLVLLASAQLQMVIEEVANPFVSIALVLGLDIASVQFPESILLGNYSMLSRNELLNSVQIHTGILVCVTVLFISILMGALIFDRKDIIGRSHENNN